MITHTFKNYLRTSRKKLGLNQRHLAAILGLKSSARISALELGQALPRTPECVAFRLLFKRSFDELWPRLNFEIEAATDLSIRRLIIRLEQEHIRSERKRTRVKIIRNNLAIVIDGLPEDVADVI